METSSSSLLPSAFLGLLLLLSSPTCSARAEQEAAAVLTLDAGNLSEAIAAHQFIVVNFYAPWCYWSNKLAPEYEKAASILRSHDPPIVLAKIDASGKNGKDRIREKHRVLGYPTIMFMRNGGSTVQQYLGARDAESIVRYLKKQVGRPPASTELRSAEDATSSITDDDGKGKGKVTDDGPIPALNDQPVKKVSPNNLHGVISSSAKKVLLELRERMKRACQMLVATIIEAFTMQA